MNHQVATFKLAKKKGLNPATLSPLQSFILGVQVRSPREVVRDGFQAINSIAQTSVGLHVLPAEQVKERQRICESNECGSFTTLTNGLGRCHRCSCGDMMLAAKQEDDREDCPGGYWPNKKG